MNLTLGLGLNRHGDMTDWGERDKTQEDEYGNRKGENRRTGLLTYSQRQNMTGAKKVNTGTLMTGHRDEKEKDWTLKGTNIKNKKSRRNSEAREGTILMDWIHIALFKAPKHVSLSHLRARVTHDKNSSHTH